MVFSLFVYFSFSDDLGFAAELENDTQQVPLTPSKKRRLTYELVPGAKNGQTRLTFY